MTLPNWCEADDYAFLEHMRTVLVDIQSRGAATIPAIDDVYAIVQRGLDAFNDLATIDKSFNEKMICDTPLGSMCLRQAALAFWTNPKLHAIPVAWSVKTRLRLAAGLTAYQGITMCVVNAILSQQTAMATACALRDKKLWIPVWPLFQTDVHLEFELDGYGPGFKDDPDAAWAVQEKPGLPGFLRAWATWVCDGVEPTRGFVTTPQWPLSMPAFGIPCTSIRARPIIDAWMSRTVSMGAWATPEPISPIDITAHGGPCPPLIAMQQIGSRSLPDLTMWMAAHAHLSQVEAFRLWIITLLRHITFGVRQPWGQGIHVKASEKMIENDGILAVLTPQGTAIHGDAIAQAMTIAGALPAPWLEYQDTPRHLGIADLAACGWRKILDEAFPDQRVMPDMPWHWSDGPWLVIPEIQPPCGLNVVKPEPWRWPDLNPWSCSIGPDRICPSGRTSATVA